MQPTRSPEPRKPVGPNEVSLSRFTESAQRAAWAGLGIPFGLTVHLGGGLVATALALWLLATGRAAAAHWRVGVFVAVSWLLWPLLGLVHVSAIGTDAVAEVLRRSDFDAQVWRASGDDTRTTMAHDLVQSGQLLDLDRDAVTALLGGPAVRFGRLTSYDLVEGGLGYRRLTGDDTIYPSLVLLWTDDRVERVTVGRWQDGRPYLER